MRIYLDESGDFQIPMSRDDHKAAIVTGIVVPEVSETSLMRNFSSFVSRLSAQERKGIEPKGARLCRNNRLRFTDLLADAEGVLVIPTTIDLSELADRRTPLTERLINKLTLIKDGCVHSSMQDEMALLARQVTNLSDPEALKLVCYATCIQECVHHAVALRSHGLYRACWDSVEIVIDQLSSREGTREKTVFGRLVLPWLAAWSKRRPLALIEEIHTDDHPFVQKYTLGEGINMRRLFRDGLRWADSSVELGLQIADVAAAIVRSAAHDIKNQDCRWGEFISLTRCCPLAPQDCLGLITLLRTPREATLTKYAQLVYSVQSRFPERCSTRAGLKEPPDWAITGCDAAPDPS